MKLKAPKTWQLVVILVVVFVLAIGGSFLAVYLTTGFRPQSVYPESIVVEDEDLTYNQQNSQYEVVENFNLMITSPTADITNNQVTLSFAPGKSVTRTEDGKISDGTIIVPEQVTLNQSFTVELVQAAYTGKDGEPFTSNAGGISSLVITTENNLLSSSTITIAVDVPVHDVEFTLVDATTGIEFGTEGEDNRVAENTNFEIQTTFYPEASRYLYSDNVNPAISQNREKQVFFNVSNVEGLSGVTFEYNEGDVYFIAGDEPSRDNLINGYVFANAKQQIEFFEANSQISGLPLYSEAIRVLSGDENAAKSSISVNVVEANVGSFTINDTSSSPLNLTSNKLFRLSAGNSSLSNASINIQIRDVHDGDLSALIKNVGVRILTIDGQGASNSSASVTIRGGESITVGEGDSAKQYTLISSNVKNLNHAYWEISTDGEHEIVLEVVLITADENGDMVIFDEQTQRTIHFVSTENAEEAVSWNGIEDAISMSIIYDANGNVISSQYKDDLNSVSYVPSTNTYQKKVFFAYIDESSSLPEGQTLADYVSVSDEGSGRYQIAAGVNAYLYPLVGSELIVKDAIDFNLIFATVRTDAYGNAIMTTSGTYQLQQISSSISVEVEKTLQGLTSASLQIDEQWLNQEGGNIFAIPTGTTAAFMLNLTLVEGDGEIFMQEYNAGRINFYAAEDVNGTISNSNVFSFGQPDVIGNQVNIQVNVANYSVEETMGRDFYVCISYNNSINTNVWVAEPAGDGQDYYGAIRVYNQTPAAITNQALDGWTFDVEQTLNKDGTGSLQIDGQKEGEEPVLITDISEFNALINGTTSGDGTKTGGMQITDQYGRQFEYAYEITSSNANAVTFSSVGGGDYQASFGDANAEGVIVTVRAGSQTFTFTVNTSSTGIIRIEVGGEDQGSTAEVQYTMAGKKDSSITLKDLLTIYVRGTNGDVQYEDAAYSLAISPSYISSVDPSLWEMFNFGDGVAHTSPSLNSVGITQNFGQSVSIPFVASNQSGTLNFTFTLNITSVASDGQNNLGNVDYQIEGIEQGVREQDKPENASSTDVFVYAGYKINLNQYLPVNMTDVDFNWGEVEKYKTTYELEDSAGAKIGVIETYTQNNNSALNGTYLTFNDVNTATRVTFTLYAYFNGDNGNTYAYHREVTLTILPNFEMVPSGGAEASTLELTSLLAADGAQLNSILEIVRITGTETGADSEYTSTKYAPFTDFRASNYISFKTNTENDTNPNITLSQTMNLAYGETQKVVTVTAYDSQGVAVASCPVTIIIGITREDMVSAGVGDWLGKTVLYDGQEMVLVSNSSEDFLNQTIENAELSIQANQYAYSLRTVSGGGGSTLEFNASSEISVGTNFYLNVHFNGEINGAVSTLATMQIPVMISNVGDQFASYQDENDDLQQILESTHAAKGVDAGQEYLLMAPSTIAGRDYFMLETEGSAEIALIDATITGTSQEIVIGGNRYSVSIGENGGITGFTPIDGTELAITEGAGATEGQTFVANNRTYYVESITASSMQGVYDITLYQITRSAAAEGATTIAGIPYDLEKGAFGWEITEFGGFKVLTGLSAANGSADISFAVPNQFGDFMKVDTNQTYGVPSLTIEHVNGSAIDEIEAYFTITQASGSYSLSYNYNILISPDGKIAPVTYPFNGSTSEFLEMEAGTSQSPTTQTINLAEAMGSNTQHPGEKRIADQFLIDKGDPDDDITDGATLKIQEVRIGDDIIEISEDGLSATDARFSVSLNGMSVTFNNVSGQNVTVVLVRSYTAVYGGDLTYTFSINSQAVEYFIEYTNPSEDKDGTLSGSTWSLPQGGKTSVLTATTKQRTDVGESNVDTTRVTTTITHDLPEGYVVNYTGSTFTLSIKQPAFVPQDTTYHIYFTVNGSPTATLDVFVPATITAAQITAETFVAGKEYSWDKLVSLSGEGVSVTNIDANAGDMQNYVTVQEVDEKQGIAIHNSLEDISIELTFTYSVPNAEAEDEPYIGYVTFTYNVLASMRSVASVNGQNVVAQTTKEINLSEFVQSTQGGLGNSDWRHFGIVSAQPQDTNIISAGNIGITYGTTSDDNVNLTIKPEYVGSNTPTSISITFGYYALDENNQPDISTDPLFTFDSVITLTVTPAVSIAVNYPAPGGETLAYESLAFDKYQDFFNGTANFGSAPRFVVTNLSNNTCEVIDYEDNFSFSVVQSSNINVNPNGGNLTISKGSGSGLSYATIQIIYKGVMAQYTFYAFDSVITSTTNATINQSGSVETIYADRTPVEGLGGRYRLLELNVDGTASDGSVYQVYAVAKNGAEEWLTSFKMSNTYFGRTIYVDHGNNDLKYNADGEPTLDGNTVSIKIRIGSGSGVGVEFSRLAARAEYRYATNDGSSILITSDAITYYDNSGELTKWAIGDQATLKVSYTLDGISSQGETSLTLVKQMDIAVENEYDPNSPTYIEVQAHRNSVYRLVNEASITFASTGEALTAEAVANARATMTVEVVNPNGNSWPSDINKTMAVEGNRAKPFVYQNDAGSSYLLFTNITGGENNRTVYDFYLYAQGCAVDGDFVLLKFTYTVDEQSREFYIVVKIVPDYQVTIAGTTIAEAGQVNTVADGNSNYVSNQQRPYEFTPVVTGEGAGTTYEAMTLASTSQTAEGQLISVVRRNWNTINIASSFNYKITVQTDGTGYNAESTIGKLRLTDSGWTPEATETTDEPGYYTSTGDVSIAPDSVVFGTKSYMVELTDDFGYVIRFYFNLVPSSDQQPEVYQSASAATFTEGTAFDIGVVYDAISAQADEVEEGEQQTYTSTVNPSQVPQTNDVSSIILQNLDAWGYTTSGRTPEDISGIDEKYESAPTFAGVTITNITFRYDESTARTVAVDEIKRISINEESALPGGTLNHNNVDYVYTATENGISLQAAIRLNPADDENASTYITLNGHDYSVSYNPEDDAKIKVNNIEFSKNEETGVYTNTSTNKSFTVRSVSVEEIYFDFVFTAEGNTANAAGYSISLDFENGSNTGYAISNASSVSLATDVTLSPLKTKQEDGSLGADAWANVYRDLASGNFTVPTMPGWIYGTSDSATVTIIITLDSNRETCQVSYNATITKNPIFSSSSRVVVDAEEFAISSKVNVSSRTTTGTVTATFYDDTLLVIVPSQGQVSLELTFTENGESTTINRTINNTNTTRPVANYLSLSEIYGKTLNKGINISVYWQGSNGAEVWKHDDSGYSQVYNAVTIGETPYYFELTYSGSNVVISGYGTDPEDEEAWTTGENLGEGDQIVLNGTNYVIGFTTAQSNSISKLTLTEAETEATQELNPATFNLAPVTHDTLYIENAGRIVGSDYYSVRKSYVIKVGDEYYQYRHDFYLTSAYTYFDDGLTGGNTVDVIYSNEWGEKDGKVGYTVDFSQWAGDIMLYRAVDGDNGGVKQEEKSGSKLSLFSDNLNKLRFEVARVDESDPNPPTAFFDEDGITLYTGADYELNNNQYIRINIYVKASGGPNAPWSTNNFDKLLGFIIITLTGGNEVTASDGETFAYSLSDSNSTLELSNIVETKTSNETVKIDDVDYVWEVGENGLISFFSTSTSSEGSISLDGTQYTVSVGNGVVSLSNQDGTNYVSTNILSIGDVFYKYSVTDNILTLSVEESENIVSQDGQITIGDATYSVTITDTSVVLTAGETVISSPNQITVDNSTYNFSYSRGVLTMTKTEAQQTQEDGVSFTKGDATYVYNVISNASTEEKFLQLSEIASSTSTTITISGTTYNWKYDGNVLTLTEPSN